MKLRIVLVDDEPLARERMRTILAEEPDVEIVAECGDGPSAVGVIRRERPDVIFLDVRMPEMDGFEVLEALAPEEIPWTIFSTAYDQHAVRAFEARALDYLLKPATRERVKAALSRVRERLLAAEPAPALQEWLAERQSSRRIVVRNGTRASFVPVTGVEWIEAAGNYALIHIGRETHILRETLSDLEQRLPPDLFLRVSRGAIVNLRFVKELQGDALGRWVAILETGPSIPVTRSRPEIEKRLC